MIEQYAPGTQIIEKRAVASQLLKGAANSNA
jgi:hypothetical protein